MPRSKSRTRQRKIATEWIRFRHNHRFSQRALAETLGISRRTVQYVETGHAQQPSWSCVPSEETLERFRELQIKYANRRMESNDATPFKTLSNLGVSKATKIALIETDDPNLVVLLLRAVLDDHPFKAAQAIAGKPARKAASTRQPKNRQPAPDKRIHLVKQRAS